jgi:threonine/homoserine/homoserine lactone efflux protein
MNITPDLWLFFLLVLGIIALPGMDMAYVSGSTLAGGLRSGFAALAGIVVGGMVHVVVAATGVAALMVLWPLGFNLLLVGGAVYMAWIGWQIWQSANAQMSDASPPALATDRVFWRGAASCLLNPKAYAFMLAVFPAFMAVPGVSLAAQAAKLSAVIAGTQIAIYGAVAIAAAQARQSLLASAQAQRTVARGVAGIMWVSSVLTVVLAWKSV